MRHFVFGLDGHANILEDGSGILAGLDPSTGSFYQWDTSQAELVMPSGASLGQYDFRQAASFTQLVSTWNNTPEALQYGTARVVTVNGQTRVAITLRGTSFPLLTIHNTGVANNLLQVNGRQLIVNGYHLAIN